MKMNHLICAVTSAVIGAGFASGREIMHFFTRWGELSWLLTAIAAGAVICFSDRVMRAPSVRDLLAQGKYPFLGRWMLLTLLFCVAGAMTAAAGELAALTLPMGYARSMGALLTLALCMALSGHSLTVLKRMGCILMPLILLAWILCIRAPKPDAAALWEEKKSVLPGVAAALCYSAMNVMLSAGVLCEAGRQCSKKERFIVSIGIGCAAGLLLGLGNFAFFPHRFELMEAPLPTVMLLRSYGKMGYYLSAAVLYLAAMTTLISVIQGISEVFPERIQKRKRAICFLVTAALSLCGFGGIVASAYPLAGGISLVCLAKKQKTGEGKSPSPACRVCQESRNNS